MRPSLPHAHPHCCQNHPSASLPRCPGIRPNSRWACHCDNCGGDTVTQITWYRHNPVGVRRRLPGMVARAVRRGVCTCEMTLFSCILTSAGMGYVWYLGGAVNRQVPQSSPVSNYTGKPTPATGQPPPLPAPETRMGEPWAI